MSRVVAAAAVVGLVMVLGMGPAHAQVVSYTPQPDCPTCTSSFTASPADTGSAGLGTNVLGNSVTRPETPEAAPSALGVTGVDVWDTVRVGVLAIIAGLLIHRVATRRNSGAEV